MTTERVTADQLNQALTLTYQVAHACREQGDYRLWSALVKLAPIGVVRKRALELQKDQRAERQEMRAAMRRAARRPATKRPAAEFKFRD